MQTPSFQTLVAAQLSDPTRSGERRKWYSPKRFGIRPCLPIEYWQPRRPRGMAIVSNETLEVLRPLARRQLGTRRRHASITGDQEYSTTLQGDFEILSIKHSAKSHMPQSARARMTVSKSSLSSTASKLTTFSRTTQPGCISLRIPKTGRCVALGWPDCFPSSGDADVLAGETGGEDIHRGEVMGAALTHVFELACMGKSIGKHSPGCDHLQLLARG